MDYNGEIYDPFDGISDLNNGVVKFIGDPEKLSLIHISEPTSPY